MAKQEHTKQMAYASLSSSFLPLGATTILSAASAVEAMDTVYHQVRGEWAGIFNCLEASLRDKQADLERMKVQMSLEMKAVENERVEFEHSRSQAVSQLEAMKTKLDGEKRDLETASADMRASIDAASRTIAKERDSLEGERVQRRAEISEIMMQMERDRATLQAEAEYVKTERRKLSEERNAFEETRRKALVDRDENERSLARAVAELERSKEDHTRRVQSHQARLSEREESLERISGELVAQQWRLLQEKKHHDAERKQLAKLLLGVGEKISTSDYNPPAKERSHGVGDNSTTTTGTEPKIGEIAVFNGQQAGHSLLGTLPIHPSTTVGSLRARAKELASTGMSAAQAGSELVVRRGSSGGERDSVADTTLAMDWLRPGDCVVAEWERAGEEREKEREKDKEKERELVRREMGEMSSSSSKGKIKGAS
eukprot:jgi/Chlat1/5937/Chrsp4S06267